MFFVGLSSRLLKPVLSYCWSRIIGPHSIGRSAANSASTCSFLQGRPWSSQEQLDVSPTPVSAAEWAPSLFEKQCDSGGEILSTACVAHLTSGLNAFASPGSRIGPNLCAVIANGTVAFLHRAGGTWTEKSLFRIFSMTKPIVAVAFLTLVDQGLVSLDDPLAKYLPSFEKVSVLGFQLRARAAIMEQLQRLLFEPERNSKALAAATAQGCLKEGGWMKLDFVLRSPQLRKMNLGLHGVMLILKKLDALEVEVDSNGCVWVRRRAGRLLKDELPTDDSVDLEEPRWKITLRMLMTHTAGFGYDCSVYRSPPTIVHKAYGELARDVENGVVVDLAQWVDRLAQIPLLFHPGEDFRYGYSFDVLGRVAEVVSGKSLDKFLHDSVLEPVGMFDTSFSVPLSKIERLVPLRRHHDSIAIDSGRDPFIDMGCKSSRWAEGNSSRVLSGGGAVETVAGGLVSTLHDYVKFLSMLLDRGVTADGRRILQSDTVKMAMDGRQLARATDGFVTGSFPGRSFGLLGEVVGPRLVASGLVSWGGTAGTYFGIHSRLGYAFVFMSQTVGAPKVKPLFENHLCSEFS
eukprot:TRINITY_DN65033_c0_g1_i1.p1 TRINITY_DN65033_c0_g1~~TRINITY_DN65033_c0_g1_i1.p1  ORF type:complete len:657 (-),score=62.71 TRINITY_DN65033_c0_g1_i1:288-2009(-)